ncbi:lantibiotic dehydratase C-terminal domain-containing protein [Paucisalibacillus sp. EB02]|uniref:lantibiotic dehydratase C-terminal domain-containing protein n=1 Tax=Paucisalibacillus sp. EB02 TaxID=1347087 RepID=UPI0004B92320|nr:lantibiotic dehydratase C-terminal domain-containing protein [Paucisalibacillus sp. EB02]
MWYSLHGFIHDFKALDDYLKSDFQDVIQDDIETYFFIRYWLGGPHVRLRFTCKPEDYPKVKKRFEESIANFLAQRNVDLIDYKHFYQNTALENENITHTYWCEHGSVVEFEYEPEYERYGGREVMGNSEQVFYESSILANKLNKVPFGRRIIVGLDLIYLTFQLARANHTIYGNYADFWRNYGSGGELIDSFDHTLKQRLNHLQKHQVNQFAMYNDYFDCIKSNDIHKDISILISHVHMTNNRLGIFPAIEHNLALFIANNVEVKGEIVEKA